jgi:hypothetical protein
MEIDSHAVSLRTANWHCRWRRTPQCSLLQALSRTTLRADTRDCEPHAAPEAADPGIASRSSMLRSARQGCDLIQRPATENRFSLDFHLFVTYTQWCIKGE